MRFDFPESWALSSFDELFVIVSGVTKGQKVAGRSMRLTFGLPMYSEGISTYRSSRKSQFGRPMKNDTHFGSAMF
jgi:hypothetical protein